MNTNKNILIKGRGTKKGFVITVGNREYPFSYEPSIWNAFPHPLKKHFIETITVFSTRHLGYAGGQSLTYDFPAPASYPLFFQGYIFSIAGAPFEFPDKPYTIPELLKDAYNSEFKTKFTGIPDPTPNSTPFTPKKNKVLMAFSFGKDSLLTFAILKKFGYDITPVYLQEPASSDEVRTKLTLKTTFEKNTQQKITTFPMTLGALRDSGGDMWGWDLLLMQYTLLLMPYMYKGKYEYFFWSNEQALSESITTSDGYQVNPTFDQTAHWTNLSNTMLRTFGINTKMSSIVEPLYDMTMLSILHHQFPDIGAHQLSCDLPEKPSAGHRWCGSCHECARQYILMLGVGVNPHRVGLKTNMLDKSKINFHHFFNHYEEKDGINSLFQSEMERKLAFYLAYKRGIKGDLMTLFEKQFLSTIEKNKNKLINKYFSIRSTDGIPDELKKRILPFYTKEIEKIKRDIMSPHPAPVDKF